MTNQDVKKGQQELFSFEIMLLNIVNKAGIRKQSNNVLKSIRALQLMTTSKMGGDTEREEFYSKETDG